MEDLLGLRLLLQPPQDRLSFVRDLLRVAVVVLRALLELPLAAEQRDLVDVRIDGVQRNFVDDAGSKEGRARHRDVACNGGAKGLGRSIGNVNFSRTGRPWVGVRG